MLGDCRACLRAGLNGLACFTAAVVFLAAHSAATCPVDVTHAVFACFGSLTKSTARSFLVAGGDVRQLRAKCRDGSFVRTASCVNDLFRSCRKRPHRIKELEYIINPQSVRRSFTSLCQNFQMYSDSSPCLKRHSRSIDKCIDNRKRLFKRFQSAPSSRDYAAKEELSNLICNFMSGVTRCIERPVRAFCSCQLADFITEFMSGIAPPNCPRYDVIDTCKLSARTNTSQTWAVVAMAILSVFYSTVYSGR